MEGRVKERERDSVEGIARTLLGQTSFGKQEMQGWGVSQLDQSFGILRKIRLELCGINKMSLVS